LVKVRIMKKLGSDGVRLDHMLRICGPVANEARADLRAWTVIRSG
jgi:hypothetical protein